MLTFEFTKISNGTGPEGQVYWDSTLALLKLNGKVIAEYTRGYPSYPYVIAETDDAYFVYHSPKSYMRWMVTRVSKATGSVEDKDLGGISWQDLGFGYDNPKRSEPILCFAQFKVTPDSNHLFISCCTWGGPYYDLCFNIKDKLNPEFTFGYWNYEDDDICEKGFKDASIIELYNDHVVMETDEMDDEDRPFYKYSIVTKDKKPEEQRPYILTEYHQYTNKFKWFFLEDRYEFISRQNIDSEPMQGYCSELRRATSWPLEMSDEEIWAKDLEWLNS